ncbi:hypothetical protein HY641_00300 [Candidatus Woesearchaeota archaeon]|nr:hypothetical protein [Candidatus Woesearchaeota archaeon]
MLIKSHPHLVLPGLAVAFVALVALMSVPTDAALQRNAAFRSLAGNAVDEQAHGWYTTVGVRQHQTFSSRLCPDPRRPVPVLRTMATTGTGKVVIHACVTGQEPIPASRWTFEPSQRRKDQATGPYAHVFRVLS